MIILKINSKDPPKVTAISKIMEVEIETETNSKTGNA